MSVSWFTNQPGYYSVHPHFFEDALRNAYAPESILLPGYHRDQYCESATMARDGKIAIEEAAGNMMTALFDQMVAPLQPRICGTLKDMVEEKWPHMNSCPAIMKEFVRRNPRHAKLPIYEFEPIKGSHLNKKEPQNAVDWLNETLAVLIIGEPFYNLGRLVFQKGPNSTLKIFSFPMPFFLGASLIHFKARAVRVLLTANSTSLAELIYFQENNKQRPACLDPRMIHRIHEFNRSIPPYTFGHDLAHVAIQSSFDSDMRQDLPLIARSTYHSGLSSQCLDGPFPYAVEPKNLYLSLFNFLLFEYPELVKNSSLIEVFLDNLRRNFSQHSRRHLMWEAIDYFQNSLKDLNFGSAIGLFEEN